MQNLPFGVEVQHQLLKMLVDDEVFCHAVHKHLSPAWFDSQELGWVCAEIAAYYERYEAPPSFAFLRDQTAGMAQDHQKHCQLLLERIEITMPTDKAYVRSQMVEMIRRHKFMEAWAECSEKFNSGDSESCFATMRDAMDEIHRDLFQPPDQEFFFEDFEKRQEERKDNKRTQDAISTGFETMDRVLHGGLSEGELGLIIAPPKAGKSTLLVHLGATAVRDGRRVLHIVLEGSRRMIADRYESAINDINYESVREGTIPNTAEVAAKYRSMQGRLVLRAFTDRWDVTAKDIGHVLEELDRYNNWKPELIVIDYGDLMKGRGNYGTDYAQQRDVYRDLMTLAKQGYAVWTASQSRRPDENQEGPITSRQVSDSYEKVRVASFICSINRTPEEAQKGEGSIWAEMYRDGVAGVSIPFTHKLGHFLWHEKEFRKKAPQMAPARGAN